MSLEIGFHDDVFCDLQEIGCQLRRHGPELGTRFTQAAQSTFAFLRANSLLGRLRPELGVEGMRSWPVKGFGRYLIFYVPTETHVHVLRVLHGSRDLRVVFD